MRVRYAVAVATVMVINRISRLSGRGSGTVVGGKAGLKIDANLLAELSERRSTVLISGTNGKTTTTAFMTAALRTRGPVATNATGSNMPAGHVAALVEHRDAFQVALEVDEAYLAHSIVATHPDAIVLLNLSRDQLDRMNEVRKLAERWRTALEGYSGIVIANADDPMVVYATRAVAKTIFVEAGLVWSDDAIGCPSCGGEIVFGHGWACDACDLDQPPARWRREGNRVFALDEQRGNLEISIPGSFNVDNALLVVAASDALDLDVGAVCSALTSVGTVAGRFEHRSIGGVDAELMLAKNPAGWAALLAMVAGQSNPIVVSINARIADGADPSWLWDVDFSRLAGRTVIASGDRWRDLSVRLDYADVAHDCEPDSRQAVLRAGHSGGRVMAMGNYTAFGDLRKLS